MDRNTHAKLLIRGNTELCGCQCPSPVLLCAWLAHALPSVCRRCSVTDFPGMLLLIKCFSLWRIFLCKREDVTEFQPQILSALKSQSWVGLQVMSYKFMGFALHSFSPSLSLHFSLKWLSWCVQHRINLLWSSHFENSSLPALLMTWLPENPSIIKYFKAFLECFCQYDLSCMLSVL